MDPLLLVHLLKNASSCCEKELSDALGGMDVSLCKVTLLMNIADDGTSMSKLSKALCCHKSNVTQIVDALVKDGYAERVQSEEDRRVSNLKITTKGKKMLDAAVPMMKQASVKCFACLSADEQKKMYGILEKFVEGHVHS